MGLRINTNVEALNAHRNLGINASAYAKSVERLSSGLRVNRAGDDAAGLAISEKLRSQVKGLNQASRNAQDGISLIQTAEGALNESHSILQRMRELSVEAANDTLTLADRGQVQSEFDALATELTRISTDTEFNTMALLDGTFAAMNLQVGANASQTIAVSITNQDAATLGVGGLSLNTNVLAGAAITAIDAAIEDVSTSRADLGAIQNRLEHTIANLGVAAENISASESRIRDTDMAAEMASFTRNQIMQQAATSILAQANSAPQSVLQLLQ